MTHYDALLIPGAGVRTGGELPSWTRCRLDRVLERYARETVITLSAGTVHKPPPLDGEGFPIFESLAAARYLIKHGFDPQRIEAETVSYDTIGNAYFSRILHVQPNGFRRLLVITPEFHFQRTKAIFDWVYSLDAEEAAFSLDYRVVRDPELSGPGLEARRTRERVSLERFRKNSGHITSLAGLHGWLYRSHAAYAAGLRPERVDGDALKMY